MGSASRLGLGLISGIVHDRLLRFGEFTTLDRSRRRLASLTCCFVISSPVGRVRFEGDVAHVPSTLHVEGGHRSQRGGKKAVVE